MAKNLIATKVDQIEDPKIKEVLQYIIAELDRVKALPPVDHNIENIATIVNKITRSI